MTLDRSSYWSSHTLKTNSYSQLPESQIPSKCICFSYILSAVDCLFETHRGAFYIFRIIFTIGLINNNMFSTEMFHALFV